MEISVADTAEKDFDLNVIITGITPRDRGGDKRRTRTGSRIGLRLILTT
jgi:hypothetical protein